jgi:hypothetical protein
LVLDLDLVLVSVLVLDVYFFLSVFHLVMCRCDVLPVV